jgi:polysaccharide export outer membrane protein
MTVRPLFALTACLLATGCALPFTSKTPAAALPIDAAQGTASVSRGAQEPALLDTATAPAPAPAAVSAEPAASPTAAGAATPDAPPAAPSAAPARFVESAEAFRIGPEDVLDVQVWKNEELSRVVPVRPDGMISLPLVNDIRASGLTAVQLRQEITKRLAEYVPSPEVSVMVREVHSVKVAVLGAVRMPGHYEVKSSATVLELIARAQGLNEFADRGRIVVLRQNGTETTRIPFNYRKVAEGSEQDNFYVRPGDIIVVP